MRGEAIGEAESAQQVVALVGTPLGDGQDREVVREDGCRGQSEDCREGEASALTAAGVGDGGESGQSA